MRIVFDIDDTIVWHTLSLKDKEVLDYQKVCGTKFLNRHAVWVDPLHYVIFPGFLALFRWLNDLNVPFSFFSAARAERNEQLVPLLMKKAFPKRYEEILKDVRIFSRHHCIETTGMSREENAKLQCFLSGMRKKKLAGVVCTEEELPHTLLIEDDYSYMVKGEEKNFVPVQFGVRFYSEEENSFQRNNFLHLHQAYYLCGLFMLIFDLALRKNLPVREAAWEIQVAQSLEPFVHGFRYQRLDQMELYWLGLSVLRQYDPQLRFYLKQPPDEEEWMIKRRKQRTIDQLLKTSAQNDGPPVTPGSAPSSPPNIE